MIKQGTNKRSATDLRAKEKISDRSAAFTLIEVLVAVSIFTLAMLAVAGIFMSVINTQRVVINMENVKGAANFMLESMTKEVRMRSIVRNEYTGSKLVIEDADGNQVTYEFRNNEFQRNGHSMHSDNIVVKNGAFFIQKSDPPIRYKIVVRMTVEAKDAKPELQATMNFQTAVTPRGPQR